MAIARINFYPEREEDQILLKTELDMDRSELDEIIEAWAKKALEYSLEIKECEVPFDHDLWMIDEGVTLLIENDSGHEYNDDDSVIEDFSLEGNPMKISLRIDVSKNIRLIGGLSTPSYQTAMIVAESLETALKRVSM